MQGKAIFRVALGLLHLLTIDRNRGIDDVSRRIPAGHTLSRPDTLERFPNLDPDGLTGAAVFYDGAVLNPPRLVFEIIQTAAEAGAVALNYCEVTKVESSGKDNQVTSVTARDCVGGGEIEVRARSVINAAGPYAPWLPGTDVPGASKIPFSRDMAFVIDRVSDDRAALAVQTRYRDPDAVLTRGNRHLFMVPWRDYTLVGVNSRLFDEHPGTLDVTEAEIGTFIDEINEACPKLGLGREDVLAVNAGLLPFGDNATDATNLSFGKRSLVQDLGRSGGPSGVVNAISVRWTMGRATAEAAVNCVEHHLRGTTTPGQTAHSRVRSAIARESAMVIDELKRDRLLGQLTNRHLDSILGIYGSRWDVLRDLAAADPSVLRPIGDSTTLRGQVQIAASCEQVTSLADIVLRRTDLGSGEQPSNAELAECADIAAPILGWSPARKRQEIEAVSNLYPFYGLPRQSDNTQRVA
jgi:glycerol-3-phosphate dehydrogenase